MVLPTDSASSRPSPRVDELQLDALREMTNIGCGNAASALSRLVGGRRVGIDVPRAIVCDFDAVSAMFGGPETPVVVVALDVEGKVHGRLLLLMALADAHSLAGLLLGATASGPRLSEDERSAICEVANILASACLTAIGRALGMTLLPSVPRFAEDMAGAVLQEVVASLAASSDQALVMETRFESKGEKQFCGHFLVMPDLPSLPKMLAALGLGAP